MATAPSREAVLTHVSHIVGRAAYCAADFKLSDPASITRTEDCIQDCFANWEWMRPESPELVQQVRATLNAIGYTW